MPLKTYFLIFGLLMVLFGATFVASYIDLGRLNIVLAMAIAVLKAALVVLYFMHLKYSSKLSHVWAVAALIFLFTMFLLSMADYVSRVFITKGWQ